MYRPYMADIHQDVVSIKNMQVLSSNHVYYTHSCDANKCPIFKSTGFGNISLASASSAGLPINRSTPFSHIQFEFSNSSLCRFANQQVSDIHLLPLPALPVCQSTDQRHFQMYIFKNLNSLLCRIANQRILPIYLLPVPALPVC